MKRIDVHIEELVLHGFSSSDAPAIGEAVEREISGLLAEQGFPPPADLGSDLDRIDAGEFAMTAGSRPEGVGSQIGWSVYNGLVRGYEDRR